MIGRLLEHRLRQAWRICFLAARSAGLHFIQPWVRPRAREVPGGIRRIFAARLDGLGDVILTLPAFDALAAAWPEAELTVAVRPELASLLHGRASVSRVIEVPRDEKASALADRLRRDRPDLGVSFSVTGELLTLRAMARAEIPLRMGFHGGGREIYMTHAVRPPGTPRSRLEENALLISALGATPSIRTPVLSLESAEYDEAERLLAGRGVTPGRPRVAVHPGASNPSRRWPAVRFAAAARTMAVNRGCRIIVLAGEGESDLARSIDAHLGGEAVVLDRLPVRMMAAVLSRCDLLVANNSGPLHLAGAVGIPTVSVMGPSDPVASWPQGRYQNVLRAEGISCSPCRRSRCGPHDCMKAISADSVASGALELMDPLLVAGTLSGAGADGGQAPRPDRRGLRLVGGEKWLAEQEDSLREFKDEFSRTQ